jgi:hypothetical protein
MSANLRPRWDKIRDKPDLLLAEDLLSALNSELDGFNYSETTGLALEKDLTLGTLGTPGHIHLDDGDSGAVEIDVSPGELTIGADVVSTNDGPLASVSDMQAELSGKQPLDSDLTAIAATSTTSFGRSLLTVSDAAAARTTINARRNASVKTIHPQQVLDETGEYIASGNDSWGDTIRHPLFTSTGQIITGDGMPGTNINCFYSREFLSIGFPRGLVSDAHWVGAPFSTVFRTLGDTFLFARASGFDLGPSSGGWSTVNRFRIKFKATKHYAGNWDQPLCGVQGITHSFTGGPQPRPWVLYADAGAIKLALQLSDGSTQTVTHPTAGGTASLIDIDWDIDLVALYGSGITLKDNSLWPFGCGLCPVVGNDNGFWGATGAPKDVSFETLKLYVNGSSSTLCEIYFQFPRPATYVGGPSIPMIIGVYETAPFHLYTVFRDHFYLNSTTTNITVKDLVIHGQEKTPVINMAGMLGGGGLTIKDVRAFNGVRFLQSLGFYVNYEIVLDDVETNHNDDCGIWLKTASGCSLNRVKPQFARRTSVEMWDSYATINGDIILAPPGHPSAQNEVYSQWGGNVTYNRIISDYEPPYTPPFPPFLRLRPSSFNEIQWPTIAQVIECTSGGFSNLQSPDEIVVIEPREPGYTGELICSVNGTNTRSPGGQHNSDGGTATSLYGVTIQTRRDTAANWTSANPILAAGEEGYETNTRKSKTGDGTTDWNSLSYDNVASVDEIEAAIAARDESFGFPDGIRIPSLEYLLDDNGETLEFGINGDVQAALNAKLATASFQSALTWAPIYAQTTDPGVAGVPWNNAGSVVFSVGGIGSMSIGSSFVIG